jgi:hypothetical protein
MLEQYDDLQNWPGAIDFYFQNYHLSQYLIISLSNPSPLSYSLPMLMLMLIVVIVTTILIHHHTHSLHRKTQTHRKS